MIVSDKQMELKDWLSEKIGLVSSPNLVCIGNRNAKGKLIGVVGYDGCNGASIQMHSAGEGNWVTRRFLFAAFDYPFNVCKVNMVLGLIPSGNIQAMKFNLNLGFRVELVLSGAHPDGALWIMSMRREECRFLQGFRNGQEIVNTAASTRLRRTDQA